MAGQAKGTSVTTVPSSLLPLPAADRITVIDIVRGAALLGILLMNIEALVGPLDGSFTGIDPSWHGLDYWADAFVYVFVQGKFFLLFSLLFGVGFAVMGQRADAAGRGFVPMYLRRSLALLLFGLCHALFVWSGDILLIYALLSLPLLLFRRLPVAFLPWAGVATFSLTILFVLLLSAIIWMTGGMEGAAGRADAAHTAALQVLEAQRQNYGHGTWLQATAQRASDLGGSLGGLVIIGPEIFGMFLLGTWFARSGALATPERFLGLYSALRLVALPVGLLLMLCSTYLLPYMEPGRFSVRTGLAYAIAAPANLLMCLGYLGWLVRARENLQWLAAPGRMALTNYLLQSLLCTWLFYGYGLGLFEQLPRAWQVLFAVALFAVQVLASQWWLRHYRFGPFEWVWRTLTYLRWQPMRRQQTAG